MHGKRGEKRREKERQIQTERQRERETVADGGYLGDYARERRARLIASSRQIDIVSLRLVAVITHIIYARERRAGAYGERASVRVRARVSE